MREEKATRHQKKFNTENVKSFSHSQGIDLVGIADLQLLDGMPLGIPKSSAGFLEQYNYAVVLGAQLGRIGKNASGDEATIFLEKIALEVIDLIEEEQYAALIIHAEDEYNPNERIGLMSLKALARGAGLGWQGRSLLIVSPHYGPIHRLLAILTDMPLNPDKPLLNRCDDCSICIDKCPVNALTLRTFTDHPKSREEVLDINVCLGDKGCKVCLEVCPWTENLRNS